MNDIPICDYCGKQHVTLPIHGSLQACIGHVHYDRDSYVKGQDRKPLPEPRACRSAPMRGQQVCGAHGGKSAQALAAAEERIAELEAVKLIAKLGDPGTPVTDPIATLCAIAGRAVKFMETLGLRVDELTEIRATDRTGAEQLRAEVAIYERSIGRAAQVVEAIVRMGIAERFAKQNAEMTQAVVSFIDGVLTDLGHNPRDPEVAGAVAKRLELVS